MNTTLPVSNDLVQASAAITAAYVGNPSPTMKKEEVVDFFNSIHSAVVSSAKSDTESGLNGSTAFAAAGTTLALNAPPQQTAAAPSLQGSVVHAGTHAGEGIDPAKIWPEASEEQRAKFLSLIEQYNIPLGTDGRPLPRKPVDKLVSPMKVTDPISGDEFKMLKRHLSVSYGLNIQELRAMYHLPADFPVTAPAYSESKRRQASAMGLGKGSKAEKTARAASRRSASKQTETAAEAKPVKATKAKTTAKKTTKTTARRTTAKQAA